MEIQIAKIDNADRHDDGNHMNWYTITSGDDALDALIDWLNDTTSDAPHADNLITGLMGQDYKFSIDDFWFRSIDRVRGFQSNKIKIW